MASAVRIGTRSSPLARWQAEWVAGQLRRHYPDRDIALVEIKTQGDRDQNSPLATNGGIGVFTKEIQRELLEGTIDLAVHSLKDLPTQAPTGLALAVVPPREEPGDALIAPTSRTLDALPEGARVGTGSLRNARNCSTSGPIWRSSPSVATSRRGSTRCSRAGSTRWSWPRPGSAAWGWTGTSPSGSPPPPSSRQWRRGARPRMPGRRRGASGAVGPPGRRGDPPRRAGRAAGPGRAGGRLHDPAGRLGP